MSEHKHGTMSARSHEKVFEGFIRISTRFAIGTIVFLLLLAMINA